MKWTSLDYAVLIIGILVLCTHAFTVWAINFHVSTHGVDWESATEILETDPGMKQMLQAKQLGSLIFIVILGSMIGGWFGVFRKLQFVKGNAKYAANYIVCTLLFTAIYAFINDFISIIGLMW